jgi:hypothetical protein
LAGRFPRERAAEFRKSRPGRLQYRAFLISKPVRAEQDPLGWKLARLQQYPLCPIAVSVAGEVVTASLFTGRHAAHVRLILMGVGYRYAGCGIWLDGFRENALLNFGKHAQVACSIARS